MKKRYSAAEGRGKSRGPLNFYPHKLLHRCFYLLFPLCQSPFAPHGRAGKHQEIANQTKRQRRQHIQNRVLLEKHGGQVAAQRREEGGMIFTVTFPYFLFTNQGEK